MVSCRIAPQLRDRKNFVSDAVLIPTINMAIKSLHLSLNDIAPIGGTTYIHNLKDNSQVKSSPIDMINNVLGKRDKEKVTRKKYLPVRAFRNLPTLNLTIPPPADDREFYMISDAAVNRA